MSKLRSLVHRTSLFTRAILGSRSRLIPTNGDLSLLRPWHKTPLRFLDLHQLANKEALEKERARLKDEMSRGYFADMSELKQHGGKIAVANKILIPAAVAVKFPAIEVNYSVGGTVKLPINSEGNEFKATLLCLSFRASSQQMLDSWSKIFLDRFKDFSNVQLYEVSFVDSWFLSMKPVKRLLLRLMKKSSPVYSNSTLQKQVVYAFGDHYDFRKQLNLSNLLTGYVFLLDKFGRVRWQGFGTATEDEISSLLSCTSLLLEDY